VDFSSTVYRLTSTGDFLEVRLNLLFSVNVDNEIIRALQITSSIVASAKPLALATPFARVLVFEQIHGEMAAAAGPAFLSVMARHDMPGIPACLEFRCVCPGPGVAALTKFGEAGYNRGGRQHSSVGRAHDS
jgi:hypothetical protein